MSAHPFVSSGGTFQSTDWIPDTRVPAVPAVNVGLLVGPEKRSDGRIHDPLIN